jgi:hypothetical protein
MCAPYIIYMMFPVPPGLLFGVGLPACVLFTVCGGVEYSEL